MQIKQKLQRLHIMLIKANIVPQKRSLVLLYSQGRATSSRDLTETELDLLISDLVLLDQPTGLQDSCNKMRRKVISIFHQLKWEHPDGTIDMNRVDGWCLSRTAYKKELSDFSYTELIEIVTQVHQYYLRETTYMLKV